MKSSHMMTRKGIRFAATVAFLLVKYVRDVCAEGKETYLKAPTHCPQEVAKRWKNKTIKNV